jgi:hypothetical protein
MSDVGDIKRDNSDIDWDTLVQDLARELDDEQCVTRGPFLRDVDMLYVELTTPVNSQAFYEDGFNDGYLSGFTQGFKEGYHDGVGKVEVS